MIKKYLYIFFRRLIYVACGSIDRFLLFRKPLITVFCYHDIDEDDWRFGVGLKEFERQITYLLDHSYKFITASDLQNYLQGRLHITKPSILLSFDDGYKSVMRTRDFLRTRHIHPIVFVMSSLNGINNEELDCHKDLLSTSEIKRLHEDGWEIGCHSATHANFSCLDSHGIQIEVIKSKSVLEKRLGFPVRYFAYPKGWYSERVAEAVKRGSYALGFSVDSSLVSRDISRFAVPRVGIDRTHGFFEFQFVFMPLSISVRKLLNQIFGILDYE